MDSNPEKHVVSVSAAIPARRDRVYALIANYTDGHLRIVPKQFTSIVVEQGGIGEGTVIRVEMKLHGIRHTFRSAISEPEPGRVLVETGLDETGAITTFTVDPGTAPADCRVTISTELPVRSGFRGMLEKTFSRLLLKPIYVKELENLARVATGPFAG